MDQPSLLTRGTSHAFIARSQSDTLSREIGPYFSHQGSVIEPMGEDMHLDLDRRSTYILSTTVGREVDRLVQ
jgi:hypothetical protein